MKNRILFSVLFYLSSWSWTCFSETTTEPEKSVVYITTFLQQPLWNMPWQFGDVQKVSGSGFVIQGKRIMTNAHVVSWAKEILVKRYHDSRSYLAKVKFIGHDCDLAILEVEDPIFFDGLEPLAFGDLPKVRSTVFTYGYPAGGEQISYTRGVVSRIEMQLYSHIGNRSFLAVQTDAAINPGNSGGPVIQDDKVVGVAFQGIMGLENAGFFIPPPIIKHFLKDIEDGRYDGFPDAGIILFPLENPSYRRFLKMPDNELGTRVDQILDIPTTKKLIEADDVLLQVESYPIKSDGTIFYDGNYLSCGVAFDQAQHGENLTLKLWRKGHELTVEIPTFVYREDKAEGNQYDVLPKYYIYGGLVFVPLNLNYLYTLGQEWFKGGFPELRYELFLHGYEKPEERRKEPVVLATVLSHPVNANIRIRNPILVDEIDRVRINSMEDVVHVLENSKEDYHVFKFSPYKNIECLSRKEVEHVNAEILKTHGIAKDRHL